MIIADILRACPLFFELYEKEVQKIVSRCNVLNFETGAHIIKDGEEGNQVFIVLSGQAKVQKKTEKGLMKIQDLNQGDVFGELVLVGQQKRSADIIAKERSSILELPYEHIFYLYKKEPKIFGILLLNLSRLLSKKLKATNDIIINLQKAS